MLSVGGAIHSASCALVEVMRFLQIESRNPKEAFGQVLLLFVMCAAILVWTNSALAEVFIANARAQVILFVVLCQIPCFFTGHMWYVDIAWPGGLVLIALYTYVYSAGHSDEIRRAIVCGVMFMHGARMFFGAIICFGKDTAFTYVMDKDLARYAYAKEKWIKNGRGAMETWWVKAQVETFTQAVANVLYTSAPIMLAAFNPSSG